MKIKINFNNFPACFKELKKELSPQNINYYNFKKNEIIYYSSGSVKSNYDFQILSITAKQVYLKTIPC